MWSPAALAAPKLSRTPAAADYKWSLWGLEGEARDAEMRRCHLRGAYRLLGVCFANGGIYIKLGQHIAMLVSGRQP